VRFLLAILLLAACEPTELPAETTDSVELVLWTTQCEPEADPQDHFHVDAATQVWWLRWSIPCVRDGGDVDWLAVKVTDWDDRAEDVWNLWFVDPTLSEVRYGQADVPGIADSTNVDFPNALERVTPITPLPPGDYRAEIWAIVGGSLDAQRNEVRITVVE
jgi:hypothetical protein